MRNRLGIEILAALALGTFSLHAYERLQGPTELLYWDRSQSYAGYTLFAPQHTNVTYLIDMEGRVVHSWQGGISPQLLDNGNLLNASGGNLDGFSGIRESDWNGSNVWQYSEMRTNYFPHHDVLRIYNPKLGTNTTLYIANKSVTSNQCIAAGCNPASAPYSNATVDAIVEVDMAGNVIWEQSHPIAEGEKRAGRRP